MAFRERRANPRPVAAAPTTDSLNAHAIETLLADVALMRRATARLYVRKRYALRKLVELGVFTPEQARAKQSPLVNLLTKWRALRVMRRELETA